MASKQYRVLILMALDSKPMELTFFPAPGCCALPVEAGAALYQSRRVVTRIQ